MKKLLIIFILLVGCSHRVKYYKNGIAYYIKRECVISHTEPNLTYDVRLGRWIVEREVICDKYLIDTVAVKRKYRKP